MPLEVSYRGERFALEYGSGKRAALRLLPADPLAGVPADWRDAAPRLRRLRGLQLLLLMGLGTASVAAAGTFIALIDSAAPGAGEGQVHRLGLGLVGTLSGIVAVGLALWPVLDRATRRGVDSLALAARRLADLAATDPLTELPNHRAYQERLLEEVARAERSGSSLALVLLDLDHFKLINDEHGHPVGDLVVTEVARRLAASSRRGEIVARVGGEEFAWLLPGADAMDAWQAAERARETVSATPILEYGTLTVSAGVCELVQAGSAVELHRLADGALYWAKAHGRNRCVRYSPEVVEELSAVDRAARLERQQAMNAVHALARAVDAKDSYTQRHSERVADMVVRLAVELGWAPERVRELREAAVLHDVGKIAVPDAILRKPGPLTDEEFALVREHPGRGAEIVAEALSPEQVSWVRGHHERVDGRGYPDGLGGDEIPDGARLLALADAFDAITSDRPYRPGMTVTRALEICRGEAGGQFDADVVAALVGLWEAGGVPETAEAEPEPDGRPALSYRGAGATAVRATGRRPVAGSGLVYRGRTVEGPPR